uniref:hypothetical protein n=1 Tax=Streptomyces sp. NBC_01553 TaxID=2975877 RepID=UPI002F907B07
MEVPAPRWLVDPHASIAYGVAGPARANRQSMKALLSDHPGQPVVLWADTLRLATVLLDLGHSEA